MDLYLYLYLYFILTDILYTNKSTPEEASRARETCQVTDVYVYLAVPLFHFTMVMSGSHLYHTAFMSLCDVHV